MTSSYVPGIPYIFLRQWTACYAISLRGNLPPVIFPVILLSSQTWDDNSQGHTWNPCILTCAELLGNFLIGRVTGDRFLGTFPDKCHISAMLSRQMLHKRWTDTSVIACSRPTYLLKVKLKSSRAVQHKHHLAIHVVERQSPLSTSLAAAMHWSELETSSWYKVRRLRNFTKKNEVLVICYYFVWLCF